MGFLKNQLTLCLSFALIIRVMFSFLPAFEYDQSAFRSWSNRLAKLGPSEFYSKDVFTDNPVGFLYILWIIGLIKNSFLTQSSYFQSDQYYDLLLKFPANLADIASATLIYLLVKKRLGENWGLLGFSLYAFNPAIIFDSAIWGQHDGIATLFLLLSAYSILVKKSPEISTIFAALALGLKPQTIAFAPLLIILILLKTKPKRWFYSLLSLMITIILIYYPFFPDNPLYGLIYVNSASTGLFNCTTCFALNFWGVFGNWQNDLRLVFKLPLIYFGIIFLFISYIPIFFLKPFKKHFQEPIVYFTAAISIMAFFMLLTRIHERYLFPFFAFMLIGAILLKSKKLIFFYIFSTIIYLINLYIPYTYYNQKLIFDKNLVQILINNFSNLSFISFANFILIIFYYLKIIRNDKS